MYDDLYEPRKFLTMLCVTAVLCCIVFGAEEIVEQILQYIP